MAELQKLGRYQLRRVLGKGAMGVVYEGFDPTLNRRVAVKTILRSVAIDAETSAAYSARFMREAQAVARLNHSHIVQVHDFGEHEEVAYLVMEFIQGRELRSFFEAREKFEPAEVVRIMGELLDALDFAHEAGVIHRDIKPANVMLDGQRRVKLADFGVARIQDNDLSMAGTMVGTPAFMSPEQISGGKIDRRTDLFSAGTILYQLLTGEQPFKGEGAWTVAKKIVEEDPPAPSRVVVSVSPAFDAVVNKALAKKPTERFANAREFSGALRSAHAGLMQSVPSQVLPKPKARPEIKASETEIEFWRALQNSNDPAEFELYLEQFPEGAYAQLARIKLAKLTAPLEAARKAAEEKARQEAEEKAAEAARAKREAEERAIGEALEKSKREAAEKAKREAAEKAKREAEEKSRRAQVLARMTEQQDATVAIDQQARIPAPPAEQKRSYVLPIVAGLAAVAIGIGVVLFSSRTSPPPAPVAQAPVPVKPEPAAPTPTKPEAPTIDVEKIRRDAEERVRREYADKSAAEQAAAAKAATEKAIKEKQLAAKAAAEKAAAEKLVAEKSAQERAALERAAAERAAAEKVAAEKAAAEKAAAEKAAAERAAAEKAAAEKAAAAKAQQAAVGAAQAATPNRDGMIPGRYAFRVTVGAGFFQECDRIGLQEDIEIASGPRRSISGREFNGLQLQSAPDGSLTGKASGGLSRTGGGEYKFIGRANSAGYAGSYEWRAGFSGTCTGQWSLVRK